MNNWTSNNNSFQNTPRGSLRGGDNHLFPGVEFGTPTHEKPQEKLIIADRLGPIPRRRSSRKATPVTSRNNSARHSRRGSVSEGKLDPKNLPITPQKSQNKFSYERNQMTPEMPFPFDMEY